MPSIVFDKITVTFTNADMPSLIAEMEEFIKRNRPVELFEPKPVPIKAFAEPKLFVGERGELLKKDLSTAEFFAWAQSTTLDDENENWTAAGCNRRIKRCLKELPPLVAAAARGFAKTHKYGTAPDELVAEYLYYRWMSALEMEAGHAADCIARLHPSAPMADYIQPEVQRRELFTKLRYDLTTKLIKEHGWKRPGRNFGGTEVQQIAIDSKCMTFLDGKFVSHEIYCVPRTIKASNIKTML